MPGMDGGVAREIAAATGRKSAVLVKGYGKSDGPSAASRHRNGVIGSLHFDQYGDDCESYNVWGQKIDYC